MANHPTTQAIHSPVKEDVSVNYITSPKGLMSWLTTIAIREAWGIRALRLATRGTSK